MIRQGVEWMQEDLRGRQRRSRAGHTGLRTQLLADAAGNLLAVNLSVHGDNAAVCLYSRVGFVPVSGSKVLNRAGSESFNMIYKMRA